MRSKGLTKCTKQDISWKLLEVTLPVLVLSLAIETLLSEPPLEGARFIVHVPSSMRRLLTPDGEQVFL